MLLVARIGQRQSIILKAHSMRQDGHFRLPLFGMRYEIFHVIELRDRREDIMLRPCIEYALRFGEAS